MTDFRFKVSGHVNSQAFGRVAVLYGGHSAEREVSLASGETVLKGLLEAGVNAFGFDPKQQPLADLVTGADRVFNVMHGRGGEDGSLQGYLQLMDIPVTGSDVLGSALAMDKVRSKLVFSAQNIPTPKYVVVKRNELNAETAKEVIGLLGKSVFVKPANEGSSVGMAHAKTVDELSIAIEQAAKFDDTILVEKTIDGPEYTVAILAGQPLPVIELRTPREFYDYEAKYKSSTTEYICPCDLNEQKTEEIQRIAMNAFNAVGASGWGRVDVMADQAGNFYVLEVNTVPGMTAKSLVPMAAKAAGLELNQLLIEILKTSADES